MQFLLVEDAQLDKESSKPGDQVFEKLTAGMYMGDIARRIMSRLVNIWFCIKLPGALSTLSHLPLYQSHEASELLPSQSRPS